jgi:hypothetical protein
VLQGAEEEVAGVAVCWGDEWVAVSVLPVDVYVVDGEKLLAIAVKEDDCC